MVYPSAGRVLRYRARPDYGPAHSFIASSDRDDFCVETSGVVISEELRHPLARSGVPFCPPKSPRQSARPGIRMAAITPVVSRSVFNSDLLSAGSSPASQRGGVFFGYCLSQIADVVLLSKGPKRPGGAQASTTQINQHLGRMLWGRIAEMRSGLWLARRLRRPLIQPAREPAAAVN